ncbi:LLM class flavin-dependent oxidoreductase [Cryptosporangium aurantiacum]|uniref:Luciferase-like monooxygenase n=1 Tax=Cryptosporangium aurantiacum TaxID=134849 RepID=A0A1M7TU96_9ACTN|nr:LLM class flavin-dependent oxidoreductase [Cryptosporangium aurantiacum]SHN74285.1 Luciferase-like monooxygenase [Cryptosporangium aurantiacum]
MKPIGVALTGSHLLELLADPAPVRALDGSGFAVAVAGIDRIGDSFPGRSTVSAPGRRTIESTIAVTFLAERAPRLGWLAAAAVHRDHPYNLARRVASLDHLARGRTGLALGVRDWYAPDGGTVWGGAGLTEGVPIGAETARGAAAAIRGLWQSWPADSIVADRETGIYARAERIRRIDHHDVFDVEGPLTVPTTRQGTPVLAWRVPEAAVGAEVPADVVIRPVDGALPAGYAPAVPLLAEIVDDGTRAASLLADERVHGVLLRPGDTEDLADFLDRAGAWLRTVPGAPVAAGGAWTLRERLALPAPAPLLADARPAFRAPSPELAR